MPTHQDLVKRLEGMQVQDLELALLDDAVYVVDEKIIHLQLCKPPQNPKDLHFVEFNFYPDRESFVSNNKGSRFEVYDLTQGVHSLLKGRYMGTRAQFLASEQSSPKCK